VNEKGDIIVRPCGRPLLEGSDRCIFHDPDAWRTHAKLMRKEIKEKIKRGDLNFQKYHFPKIDFTEITKEFKRPVDFSGAVFHEEVNFTNITFCRSVNFTNAKFLSTARFYGAEFLGEAWFGSAEFLGEALFSGAEFSAKAWFSDAKFSSETLFSDAKFLGDARFNQAKFSSGASFSDAKFSSTAWFGGAKFLGEAWFDGAEFSSTAWFSCAKFSSKALFDFCRFHEIVIFDGIVMSDVIFSFRNTLFERGLSVDEHLWKESGFRLLTEKFDVNVAAESYQALRRGFENMGHYRVAGELFYREMTCRKNSISLRKNMTSLKKKLIHSGSIRFPKQLEHLIKKVTESKHLQHILDEKSIPKGQVALTRRNLSSWLWMRLFDLTCGYGERPKRLILGSILVILTFTALYFPIVDSVTIQERFKNAFLLSLDTFTPGKFLNIPFTTPGEWLVQIETVLGWFMLSLFLVVFTRKMTRG